MLSCLIRLEPLISHSQTSKSAVSGRFWISVNIVAVRCPCIPDLPSYLQSASHRTSSFCPHLTCTRFCFARYIWEDSWLIFLSVPIILKLHRQQILEKKNSAETCNDLQKQIQCNISISCLYPRRSFDFMRVDFPYESQLHYVSWDRSIVIIFEILPGNNP